MRGFSREYLLSSLALLGIIGCQNVRPIQNEPATLGANRIELPATSTPGSLLNISLPEATSTVAWAYTATDFTSESGPDRKQRIMVTEQVPVLEIPPGTVYSQGKDEKVIYLTFDDAAGASSLQEIMAILDQNNVPAAFFFPADFITANPGLVARVGKIFKVGVHGPNHLKPFSVIVTNMSEALDYFDVQIRAYRAVFGRDPSYFRPPFGDPFGDPAKRTLQALMIEAARQRGLGIAMWCGAACSFGDGNKMGLNPVMDSASIFDAGEYSKGIIRDILRGEKRSILVLAHSEAPSTRQILDQVIKESRAAGWKFGKLK